MTKQHNMGRRAHLDEEAELQEELPEIESEIGDQPTRPTVHVHHISQRSKKEPPLKPSRTHKPSRIM